MAHESYHYSQQAVDMTKTQMNSELTGLQQIVSHSTKSANYGLQQIVSHSTESANFENTFWREVAASAQQMSNEINRQVYWAVQVDYSKHLVVKGIRDFNGIDYGKLFQYS